MATITITITPAPAPTPMGILGMVLGFSAITQENAETIYGRWAVYERLVGGPLTDQPVTPARVRAMIGGISRDGRDEDDREWAVRIMQNHTMSAEYDFRRDGG